MGPRRPYRQLSGLTLRAERDDGQRRDDTQGDRSWKCHGAQYAPGWLRRALPRERDFHVACGRAPVIVDHADEMHAR